ncbi:MAG: hypothetical protein J0H98_00815 [Solirubrobacterales bacterium]|nr:hypothetical protein [Solirubrobacterales bacterium]
MRFFGFVYALTACALLGAAFSAPAEAGLRETASWGGESLPVEVRLTAVAVDDQGRAFVADAERNWIIRIEADGSSETNWQISPPRDIPREDPVDLALDDDDNVYALDHIGDRVSVFTEDGDPVTSWQIPVPGGVDVNSITWESGSIWVIGDDLVRRYSPSGQLQDSWGGFESDPQWTSPLIRGDGEGHLIVSATARSDREATTSIYRFDLDGTRLSKWSSPAQVYLGYTHGGSFITGVEQDYAIAPSPDGDVWAIRPPAGFFAKIGPSGETDRVGGSGVVPSSFDLAPNGDFIYSDRSSIVRMNAAGEKLRRWHRVELPKYTGDEFWEGEFIVANELAVSDGGVVGSYDPYLSRAQTSTSDGSFLHRFEVPANSQSYNDVIRLMMTPGGGTELLDRTTGTIERFDDQGAALPSVQLDTEDKILDVAIDPIGGYAALMWSEDEVGLFAPDGSLTGSVPVAAVNPAQRAYERIEVDSEGHIFQLTRTEIHEFDRTGEEIANWEVRVSNCLPEYWLADVAIDGDDVVYVLGSRGGEPVVLKFGSGLNQIWEESIDPKQTSMHGGYLDVGPDGSIYATTGDGIQRYDQSEAGAAPPGPDCHVDPPPPGPVRLLGLAFGPGRHWAIATIRVADHGWISVSGSKVVTKERTLAKAKTIRIAVRPRPRFLRPRARARRFKATFNIDLVTAQDSWRITRTATFKSRVRSHR